MRCGDTAMADLIANVLLFMPLGIAVALNFRRRWVPLLFAALLSVAIEVTQNLIPGRDPSLRDIIANTIGGGVGGWVTGLSGWLLPDARRAARLGLAWAAGIAGCVGLTAALLAPALPATTYYARWAPDQAAYRGRVLTASLGTLPLPSRRLEGSAQVRAMLLAGDPVDILATAGPPVRQFSSLFRIRDDRQHQIFQIGPDRDDLVLRYRTGASVWRLDQPDLRLRDAFAGLGVGDTLRIRAWREGRGVCLRINADRLCPTGFTVGSGWGLLWYPDHLSPWLQWSLGLAWIAGLLLPLGLWSRRRTETLLAIVLVLLSLFVLAPQAGLLATPPTQLLAAAAGWSLGTMLQRALRHART